MDHELLILGAGPGGYEAAIRAAQLGLNVGLIERDAVGGTCLNRGCIPTKTLLHDAGPGADFLALNAHKEQVVSTLRQGVEGLLKKRRVTVYRGTGMLTDDHTIEVDGQAVTGEKLLLAPGSRPALPPVEGIDLALTSDDLLHEPRPLESLLILGGGVMHQRQLFPMVRCRTLELLGGYVAAPEIVEHMDSYIVAPGLGDNAGAVGSLMLARRALQ